MLESAPPKESQSAAAVLMVRPARFGFNPQTAASNAFQGNAFQKSTLETAALATHAPGTPAPGTGADPQQAGSAGIHEAALREFDALAGQLARAGLEVIVAHDSVDPVKPDAIFPNNWVSFHHDGTVVLYPMMAPNRRAERRDEVLAQVAAVGFRITRTVDLCHREAQGQYLEGTGSLVLDRPRRVAYANISPRTDLDTLGEFAQQLDYDLVTFESVDAAGRPVYHTNVMLALGESFAVLCAESIADKRSRDAVRETLGAGGREIVAISLAQMQAFAGNVLELAPPGSKVIALSTTAWRSLDAHQRRTLERHGNVLAAEIPVIEHVGGGGVRCMLAEVHLPPRR
jgi:hypothetical protein